MKPVEVLEYWALCAGTALLRGVPLGLAQRFSAAGAHAVFDWGGRRTRWAMANLRIAFPELPEERRREIGRESFVHLAWNVIDLARSEKWTHEEIRRHVEVVGKEHFDAAMARGKGAIVLTLHLGNFELGALAAPLWGLRVTWVGRPIPNPRVYRRVTAQRTRTGGGLVAHRRVLHQLLRELRKGNAVGLLNDQYARRSVGVFVPFFGVRCSTTVGVAIIALRSGAPVLPAYVVRDAPDHHTARILPAIETRLTGDEERDLEAVTADCNRAYEEIIRRHPEQYWWNTRRYRRSPDLPGNPYV